MRLRVPPRLRSLHCCFCLIDGDLLRGVSENLLLLLNLLTCLLILLKYSSCCFLILFLCLPFPFLFAVLFDLLCVFLGHLFLFLDPLNLLLSSLPLLPGVFERLALSFLTLQVACGPGRYPLGLVLGDLCDNVGRVFDDFRCGGNSGRKRFGLCCMLLLAPISDAVSQHHFRTAWRKAIGRVLFVLRVPGPFPRGVVLLWHLRQVPVRKPEFCRHAQRQVFHQKRWAEGHFALPRRLVPAAPEPRLRHGAPVMRDVGLSLHSKPSGAQVAPNIVSEAP